MAMRFPGVQHIMTTGQIIQSGIFLVGLVGGAFVWVSSKDSNDQNLSGQISGVLSAVSKLDGKMDGFQTALNQQGAQQGLMDQRLRTVEDEQKDARTVGRSFQEQINELGSQLRVLQAMSGKR